MRGLRLHGTESRHGRKVPALVKPPIRRHDEGQFAGQSIFLDGGLERAKKFVLDNLVKHIDTVLEDKHPKNYKSLLQQYAQKELLATPAYQVIREEGPDHIKTFEVVAVVRGRRFKPAFGRSKKEAEQLAAREALLALQTSLDDEGDENGAP